MEHWEVVRAWALEGGGQASDSGTELDVGSQASRPGPLGAAVHTHGTASRRRE